MIINRIDFANKIIELNFKTVIELGIYTGNFSNDLLSILYNKINTFYAIDPWMNDNNIFNDSIYQKFLKTIDKYKDKIKIIKETSVNASKKFEKESIDFIYIDANHSYEFVKDDLNLWYPIIKTGGIISGHDYNLIGPALDNIYTKNVGICGVKKAVNEFVVSKNIELNLTQKDDSWWFYK